MPDEGHQPRLGPGRRRMDMDRRIRRVSWRDFVHLRRLLWGIGVMCAVSWIGFGVTAKILIGKIQTNRVHTTSQICRAVDSLRVQTRGGFRSLRSVAEHAGLRGRDLQELDVIVIRLGHPPAKQSCEAIVASVRNASTPPNTGNP